MKFKSESASLIVWDAQKSKALCRFKDYQYETNEQYIIDRLKDYEVIEDSELFDVSTHDEPEHFIEVIEDSELLDKEQQVEDLRQEAKEKGIKNWHNMRPENLIAKLRGD